MDDTTRHLDRSVCLGLFRSVAVSRLAVCMPDGPGIFPVNHIVDGGTLVIRTAPGSKLTAATTPDALVAVEADGYDAETRCAWSVVLRGPVREFTGTQDHLAAEYLPLAPWQAGRKDHFLRIEARELTGRRFAVTDPATWATALTGVRRAYDE